MKNRIITLVLSLLYLAIALTACSGEGSDKVQGGEDIVATYDLGGASFTFLQNRPAENIAVSEGHVLGYLQNTLLADSALKRLNDVEVKYNCKIKLDSDFTNTAFIASVATMDNIGDMFFSNSTDARSLGNAGALEALDDYEEHLNFRDADKWGAANAKELFMCKGVLYGVIPAKWLNYTPIAFYHMVYNNEILKTFGVPDLQEFYENKTWTLQKLEEVTKTCNDNTLATPIKGLAALSGTMLRIAIIGNGCNMLKISGDGETIESGWVTDEAIDAITWVQNFVNNNIDYLYNKGQQYKGNDWNLKDPFMNGEAAMLLTSHPIIQNEIIYAMKDFGLMPWPNGPAVEYGSWPGYYEDLTGVSIPIFAEDHKNSAILINAIFEPMEEYPDRNALLEYYGSQIFLNKYDAEILFSNNKNAQYSYWPDGGTLILRDISPNLLKKTAKELVERSKNKSDKCIEEQIYPNYLAMGNYN